MYWYEKISIKWLPNKMKKSIYATFVEKGIENKIMYLHKKIVRIYNNLKNSVTWGGIFKGTWWATETFQ